MCFGVTYIWKAELYKRETERKSEIRYIARARAFLALGDKALAKEDLQAILRMNPTHKDAVEMMRELRDAQVPVGR